jgi:hypothetical protein
MRVSYPKMRISYPLDETGYVSTDEDAESQISPELVLVDPELRARLLARLELLSAVAADGLAATPKPLAPPTEPDAAVRARGPGRHCSEPWRCAACC